jgi:hypothetical protein
LNFESEIEFPEMAPFDGEPDVVIRCGDVPYRLDGPMAHGPWRHLRTFCLFVGYGRSGHSVVGGLLDAHPNAAVSHELNAVKRFFEGVPRDDLFDEIFARANEQARTGRVASRAGGGAYALNLDAQGKADSCAVTVLGDKKGVATA